MGGRNESMGRIGKRELGEEEPTENGFNTRHLNSSFLFKFYSHLIVQDTYSLT